MPGMTPSTVLIHQVMTISLMQMIQYSSNELDFESSKFLLEAWYADVNHESSSLLGHDYVHKILVFLCPIFCIFPSQALAEQPPMYPHQFFRNLLDLASERSM